jgi:outer membrane protein TolC
MDQPRFQIRLNRQNIEISEWTYRERVMAIITSVERAYNNLIFARESVKVQQKALELVERLLVENRKRVEVGAMAPLDEQQAKSQVATTRAQLLDAERALEAQENAFINLITDAYREWHNIQIVPTESLVPIPVTLDLSESWRKGLALRPDLHRARLGIEQSELTTRFNRNQLLPRLDLVGSYGHNARGQDISYGRLFDDLGAGQNPRYSYGVVLSVPMGNFAARNRYKESKAQNAQVELQYRQLEQQVLVEIDDAVKLVETNFDRVSSTREARLFGEAALDAEQKKLENGKSTSFFVLQFQRDLTSARFDEIRALAEYNNALAQLAFLEGTTLERHKIEMEVK